MAARSLEGEARTNAEPVQGAVDHQHLKLLASVVDQPEKGENMRGRVAGGLDRRAPAFRPGGLTDGRRRL
jgi:hypothetical protein